MAVVFFIYGLAFFLLGFAIMIYPKQWSRYAIATRLRYIGLFGITHGLNEWADMALILAPQLHATLYFPKTLLLAGSFIFLQEYAVRTVSAEDKATLTKFRLYQAALGLAWIVAVANAHDTARAVDIFSRYFLGGPGALLSAIGVAKERVRMGTSNDKPRGLYFHIATTGLFTYSIAAGLVVQKDSFFPASIFNYNSFMETFGFPVQALRAACAVAISYGMVNLLNIFDNEVRDALKSSKEELERKVQERTSSLIEITGNLESEIAEKEFAQRQLQQKTQQIESIFRNLQEVVFSVNMQTQKVELISPACKEVLDRAQEFFYENPFSWRLIIHPEDYGLVHEAGKRLLTDKHVSLELRIIKRDGSTSWAVMSLVPELDATGKLVRVEGSVTDVTQLHLATERTKLALKEKELLLHEVHHRVKNNLQVAISLLKLQSMKFKQHPDVMQAFMDTKNRIKSMALIHETLYRNQDLVNISMQQYLQSLTSSIVSSYQTNSRINTSLDIEDLSFSIDMSIPLGLVVNELVSNCLSNAQPANGNCTLLVTMKGLESAPGNDETKWFELVVGIEGGAANNAIDLESSEDLGFFLLKSIVETQMGGSIEKVPGMGNYYRVVFRMLQYSDRLGAKK